MEAASVCFGHLQRVVNFGGLSKTRLLVVSFPEYTQISLLARISCLKSCWPVQAGVLMNYGGVLDAMATNANSDYDAGILQYAAQQRPFPRNQPGRYPG